VLSRFSDCVERASVDEAYIDLTAEVESRLSARQSVPVTQGELLNTHVVGHQDNKGNLLFAAK